MNITLQHIKAQAESIIERHPASDIIGIGCAFDRQLHEIVEIKGRKFLFSKVQSVLHLREIMDSLRNTDMSLVFLTQIAENELGIDVISRIARNRLFSIDLWQAVRNRFHAQDIDPILLRDNHLAYYLIESEPEEGYPPAPGGVLSADMAWKFLFTYSLEMPGNIDDIRQLIQWAMENKVDRFASAPADLKRGAIARLHQRCGDLAVPVLESLQRGNIIDAVSVGLVCDVIFSPNSESALDKNSARVRLEGLLGKGDISEGLGISWAAASTDIIKDLSEQKGRNAIIPYISRADEILREFRIDHLAFQSSISIIGFDQRLRRYGIELKHCLNSRPPVISDEINKLGREIVMHMESHYHEGQREQVQMSLRLLRWLVAFESGSNREHSLSFFSESYIRDGAFVDWARTKISGGKMVVELSDAYTLLLNKVLFTREETNRIFGESLAHWSSLGAWNEDILYVEDVIGRVLAPLARNNRILLVVLDGLSWSIMHELLQDLSAWGWKERKMEKGHPVAVISPFPSITETSRTSLLSGMLTSGDSKTEKDNFCSHRGLMQASRANFPPELYHSGDLIDSTTNHLNRSLVTRIESEKHKVIGVVINAIDDNLDKGKHIRHDWKINTIEPLGALLEHAIRGKRVVILASDHGHVLERGTHLQRYESAGDRYREPTSPPTDGEIDIRGNRVLRSDTKSIIVPWSEKVRYGSKKYGYHGGVAPQEMLPPLVVLTQTAHAIKGWVESDLYYPEWWEESPVKREVPVSPVDFSDSCYTQLEFSDTARGKISEWIEPILKSPLYKIQTESLGREDISHEKISAILSLIDTSGGKLKIRELSQGLKIPESRVRELIETAGRIFNLDGFPILSYDVDGETIVLRIELLKEHFLSISGHIKVTTAMEEKLAFSLPFEPSSSERKVIEALARYGSLSEAALSRIAETRRVGGLIETLIEKLNQNNIPLISQEGDGEEGRIYAFHKEEIK